MKNEKQPKSALGQQKTHPTDAELTRVDQLAKNIAREMGYSGTAYAIEVVSIQNWVYDQAEHGSLRMYREDRLFPFVSEGIDAPHGALRLANHDAKKVRTKFLGGGASTDGPNTCPTEGSAPISGKPWWQTEYNILEMAQSIGEKLKSEHKKPSNSAIAKQIAARIKDIERSKGRDRKSPNWDTIRGVLTGWSLLSM